MVGSRGNHRLSTKIASAVDTRHKNHRLSTKTASAVDTRPKNRRLSTKTASAVDTRPQKPPPVQKNRLCRGHPP